MLPILLSRNCGIMGVTSLHDPMQNARLTIVGVTFSAPDNENGCKNQFIIVHKHIDALQGEFTQVNCDVGQCLDHCENANHNLSRKLFEGLNDMDTKFSKVDDRRYVCQNAPTRSREYMV